MQPFRASPDQIVESAWHNRGLLTEFIRRDIAARYRGSMMGMLWSFFHPLLMLIVYTFVFNDVFKMKWGGGGESRAEFALTLFVGMLVYSLFAECVEKAPNLVLANPNYVKKVVFPLEILPLVSLGTALFNLAISVAVWMLFYCFVHGIPKVTALLLPLVISPLLLLTMGASWALASLGVYMRDVSHVVRIGTTALMFLSPVFFPLSALPARYQHWLGFNPIAIAIEQARDVLIWGRLPDPATFAAGMAFAALFACLGFAWFQKTRRGFADVI